MSAPVFFRTAAEFRRWLRKHHDTASEVMVGFYRKASGKGGITYAEALDEALCFGWIDGVRRKLDDDSYTNRFSPRRPRSNWSDVNIKRVGELMAEGRMAAPGKKAFAARDAAREAKYSYERRITELDPESRREFRRRPTAWKFFEAQPPSYRRLICNYVMSAKKDETRRRRLDRVVAVSGALKRLNLLAPGKDA
jgi:uncharacterized protein YdeI (YjbR/CyaY-like superfamily)